jgi:TolB protein
MLMSTIIKIRFAILSNISKIMRHILLPILLFAIACSPKTKAAVEHEPHSTSDSLLLHPEEMKYLKSIKQLTFGGNNAEAYWSFDDSMLVFQSDYADWGNECDQMFYLNWREDDLSTIQPKRISTGLGRTTCSYFLPGDKTIVYASTHLVDPACSPVPERRADGKYVWPIYPSFDIFTADLNGMILSHLTSEPGYDAEATVSPKGDRIVITSMRTGDLELFTMNIDGTDV